MLMGDVRAEQLFQDIEPGVRASLSPEQESAIRSAAGRNPWGTHPIDIRITLPLPMGRYFLAFVAGPDKRSAARRDLDRKLHPLDRFGNLVFLITCFGALVAFSLAFFSLAKSI